MKIEQVIKRISETDTAKADFQAIIIATEMLQRVNEFEAGRKLLKTTLYYALYESLKINLSISLEDKQTLVNAIISDVKKQSLIVKGLIASIEKKSLFPKRR